MLLVIQCSGNDELEKCCANFLYVSHRKTVNFTKRESFGLTFNFCQHI